MDCCSGAEVAQSAEPLRLALMFLTGLTMSFGHCLGMCGPIVSTFAVSQQDPARSRWQILPAMLRYHGGRILAYVLIGGLLGAVGTAAGLAGTTKGIEAALSVLLGVIMFALALGLMGLLPIQRWLEHAPLGRAVPNAIAASIRSRVPGRQFGLGVANGFLPCGPVFAVALSAAATQSPWRGMAAMLLYGLGTVPALLLLAFGTSALRPMGRRVLQRAGSALVLLIAVQLVLRGTAAFGAVPHLKLGPVVFW